MKTTTHTQIVMGADNTIAAINVTTVSEVEDDFGPYGLGDDDRDDDSPFPDDGPLNKRFAKNFKEN